MAMSSLRGGRGSYLTQRRADRQYEREFGRAKDPKYECVNSDDSLSSITDPEDDDNYQPDTTSNQQEELKSNHSSKIAVDTQAVEQLRMLTNDFSLTYKSIVGKHELQQGSLSSLGEKQIQNIIRRERQNLKRQAEAVKPQPVHGISSNLGKKRSYNLAGIGGDEIQAYKRPRANHQVAIENQDMSLAATTIKNFEILDGDFQAKVLGKINELLTDQPQLLRKALEKQVQQHTKLAIELFDAKQFTKLSELLDSVSPMAAILLNTKISLSSSNLMEQGNTLSMTLLPYIQLCSDFSFLRDDVHFVHEQFLQALIQHIQDTQMEVERGFILFSLKVNSRALAQMPPNEKNLTSLQQALLHSGFSESSSQIMRRYPSKFLWPELLKFFHGKPECMIDDCVKILAKLEILEDPANQMNTLYDIFGQRRLIVDQLLGVESIQLSISQLIIALELLCPLKQESIIEIFNLPSTKWMVAAEQVSNKEDAPNKAVMQEKLPDLYNSFTKDADEPVALDAMHAISLEVSEVVDAYRHCEYQSMIAASIVSQKSNFVVATVPTGSGKTWIQALVAKYFCQQGRRVAIIEPSELLVEQTMARVSTVDYDISVYTIDNFYQGACNNQVVIIDEYDSVLTTNPYQVHNASVAGVWMLKQCKVIAFSATSFRHIERFVNNCIVAPTILNFQSEYEVCNGVNPIQLGNIVACSSEADLLKQLESELGRHYDSKPMIVIHAEEQAERILKICKSNKLTTYMGATSDTLNQIKDQSHGVLLLLKSDCRGVDVRFSKDARVIITCTPDDYNQYLQMLGRASRTRGVCEGVMLHVGVEKASAIVQQLKSANNAAMQQLERLVQLLQAKSKDRQLVLKLEQLMVEGKTVRSCKELESEMGAAAFVKMSKQGKQ